MSPAHAHNTALWLREFANVFPGHAVCDLTKQPFDAYLASFATSAPKTRNERRGVVKMFLHWCMEPDDLLPATRCSAPPG